MNDSFSSLIDSASSILILLPNKPYFDQVAAGLSLYLSIRDRKSVSISCLSPMTVGFNRLIGVNKISSDLGDKNLTVRFTGYDGNGIERVKADLEGTEFILTVIPKPGLVSPTKDQVGFSYTGVSADLVVLVGGSDESHFPALSQKDFEGARIAHVGTRTLTSNRGIMSFAKHGSSVSELVAGLIKENELPMDVDTATNLVIGIEDGSSNFSSNEVMPETFEIFAYLLRNGGQRQPKVKLSPASFPQGAIPMAQPPVQQAEPILKQVENKEQPALAGASEENPPSDWLQPKVYKGTSVS